MTYIPSRTVVAIGALLSVLMLVQAHARRTTNPAVAAPAPPGVEGALVAAPGRIEPSSEEIHVAAQLVGRLTAVRVTEGALLRRGEVLATIDDSEYAARLASTKARAAEAAATLDRIVNGARDEERREAGAMLEEARALVEMKRAEWARREQLLAGGVISRDEAERSEKELQAAEGRHEAARQRYALITADARGEDVRRAQAALDVARADVAAADSAMAKCVIRSPIDGVVLRLYVRSGENASTSPDQPVATVADISTLHIRAEVDEADIGRVRVGQAVWATATAYGEERFRGRVVRIGQMLGRKKIVLDTPTERVDTKVLEVLIVLDPGQRLPIGLRVDTYFESD
jgi:HlyD family secretion protein